MLFVARECRRGFEAVGLDSDPAARRRERLVEDLCTVNAESAIAGATQRRAPSRAAMAALVDDIKALWYPLHFGPPDAADAVRPCTKRRLDRVHASLLDQVRCGFSLDSTHPALAARACTSRDELAHMATERFLARLPELRSVLDADVRAALLGDPAATSADEVLVCYPGLQALLQHRIAHELYRLCVPLLPRIVADLARSTTGIDIHPGAEIGRGFFIDHGSGVVIGETTRIGERVKIYQGVTLGARSFPRHEGGALVKGLLRHPIIEDDVTIYASAAVLGRVTIGRGATIAANTWVTRNVGPGCVVTVERPRRELFEDGAGI